MDFGEVDPYFPISHQYANDGFYLVQVEVTDDDGGSTIESLQVLVGLPELLVTPSAPGFVEIQWPEVPLLFRLESSPDLGITPWRDRSAIPHVSGGRNRVLQEVGADAEFYRLVYP